MTALEAWCDDNVFYQRIGGDAESYDRLRRRIEEIESDLALPGNRVFYLALPPSVFPAAITGLGDAGLEKERVELPAALAGEPAIVLVGYKQRSQFDLDRWIMGLIQADAPGRIMEVPTIPSLVASFASGWIDDGMRAGIPEEDWGAVVTLYGSAATPVAKLTGNAGSNARVLVLDTEGEIVWFGDRGFSATQALEVARITRALTASATENR